MHPNLNYFFLEGGGGQEGGGVRVSELFYKESKSNIFFSFGGGGYKL